MLNLIPTPKKCTVKDEALHAVPATVYAESPLFGEALATFCDSLKRIYDIEMTTTPDAGVSLVLDETLAAMRETARLMPQMLSQSRERYAEQVDQFVTALVRLQKSMEKLGAAADDAAAKSGKE